MLSIRKFILTMVLMVSLFTIVFAENGGSGAKEVTITFMNWYNNDEQPYLEALKEKVEGAMPGVILEYEPVTWDKMHAMVSTRITAGAIPDILDFKGQDVPKYGNEGVLMDLTGSKFLDNVPKAARTALTVDGKEYGLPYSYLYQGVFYNKEIFGKYNLSIPETYDELMQICKILDENGITPFATHFKDNWNIGNMTMQFAMAEVFYENPRWGYDLYDGKVTFEGSEGYKRVFQHVKDIFEYTFEDTYSVDLSECDKRFANGEAAMNVTGTWTVNNLMVVNPDLDFGIFPFPGRKKGSARLILEPNHTWAVSADTKYPEIAKAVLELVAGDKELARLQADLSGTNSMLIGVQTTKEYPMTADVENYKNTNQIVDVSIGNVQIKWPYQEEYSRYITEWLLGEKTQDEALEAATAYKEQLPLE